MSILLLLLADLGIGTRTGSSTLYQLEGKAAAPGSCGAASATVVLKAWSPANTRTLGGLDPGRSHSSAPDWPSEWLGSIPIEGIARDGGELAASLSMAALSWPMLVASEGRIAPIPDDLIGGSDA